MSHEEGATAFTLRADTAARLGPRPPDPGYVRPIHGVQAGTGGSRPGNRPMQTRWKVLAVALPFALLGFMLQPSSPVGAQIWPAHEGGAEPTGAQLPLLIFVGLVEAVAFGLGVAFLAFGRELLAKAPGATKGWASAAYVAIAWGLVSWVPHSSMHISNGPDDFARLILIEYLFHVTLIAAAGVIAMFFIRVLQAPSRQLKPGEARRAESPLVR